METIQIAPAYGRDYTSKQKAVIDFDADKDFVIMDIENKYNGKFCNKSQLVGKYEEVRIRYNNNRRIATIKL